MAFLKNKPRSAIPRDNIVCHVARAVTSGLGSHDADIVLDALLVDESNLKLKTQKPVILDQKALHALRSRVAQVVKEELDDLRELYGDPADIADIHKKFERNKGVIGIEAAGKLRDHEIQVTQEVQNRATQLADSKAEFNALVERILGYFAQNSAS